MSSAARRSVVDALDEESRIEASLAKVAVFGDLPRSTVAALARRVSVTRALGGNVILRPDDAGQSLHILASGTAKVVIATRTREVILSLLRPHDLFGERSFFDTARSDVSVRAIDPVTVLSISREDLVLLLATHPETSLALLAELARRINTANELVADVVMLEVEERIVRRLVSMARAENEARPDGLMIRRLPKQSDLANLVGACRESVSRIFADYARKGLLVFYGRRGRSLLVTRKLLALNP
jgi:CRP-like cAMP-binding protein